MELETDIEAKGVLGIIREAVRAESLDMAKQPLRVGTWVYPNFPETVRARAERILLELHLRAVSRQLFSPRINVGRLAKVALAQAWEEAREQEGLKVEPRID